MIDEMLKRRLAVQLDHAFVGEILDGYLSLPGQAMAPGHDRVERLGLKVLGAQKIGLCGLHYAGECDIDRAGLQRLVLHGGRHFHHRNLNLGKAKLEFLDDRGKELSRTPDKEADGQRSNLSVEGFLYICRRLAG